MNIVSVQQTNLKIKNEHIQKTLKEMSSNIDTQLRKEWNVLVAKEDALTPVIDDIPRRHPNKINTIFSRVNNYQQNGNNNICNKKLPNNTIPTIFLVKIYPTIQYQQFFLQQICFNNTATYLG